MSDNVKTKQIQIEGHNEPVTIWKLNYGYGTDIEGYFSEVKQNKDGREMSVNPGKVRLAWLIYGIYEARELGIAKPKDLDIGFNDNEIRQRTIAIRRLDRNVGQQIYDEILEFNNSEEPTKEEVEELEKKQ